MNRNRENRLCRAPGFVKRAKRNMGFNVDYSRVEVGADALRSTRRVSHKGKKCR